MKKFSLLILVLALYLVSCSSNIDTVTKSSDDGGFYIHDIEYNGHEYIQFNAKFDPRAHNGVVHNPDCKYCKEK